MQAVTQQLITQVTPTIGMALAGQLSTTLQQSLVPLQLQLQLLALGDTVGAAATISGASLGSCQVLGAQGLTGSGGGCGDVSDSRNGQGARHDGVGAVAMHPAALEAMVAEDGSQGLDSGSDSGNNQRRKVKSGYTPYRPPVR